MPAKKRLDLRVLVTRPKPQGEILCAKLRAHGASAIYFPTIEITHPNDIAAFQQQISQLDQYDWIIFNSPQAVHRITSLPSHVKIAAVGAGTAQALQDKNLHVDAFPKKEWSSEGLLNLPEFQNIEGKKIALIKGEGGRELLVDQLSERGAIVTPMIAYQRILPKNDPGEALDLLRNKAIDVIICTSNEGLQNLKLLLKDAWLELQKVPILVVSERMVARAKELGFQKTVLAKNASHEAILETLTKENNMTDQSQEKVNTNKRKRFIWLNVGILFSTLGIIILIYAFYAANNFYLKNLTRNANAQNNYQQLQNDVSALSQQVSQLTNTVKQQDQAIATLQQAQSNSNRDDWRLLEAEFLVKSANDKLQLENNAAQAILLLQSADAEIRDVNSDRILPIRKALANDIANLQAVPQVDTAGLYMRLSAINDQVNKLPLLNKPTAESAPAQAAAENINLPWWKRGLQETGQALKKIVIVRYNKAGSLPLVMPEEQDFLYLNVHAVLEKAMWALLHQQDAIYHASINQAITWIKQYFLPDSPVTQSLLTNLTHLQAINVHPAAPKMTESMQAFRDYFAQSNNQSVTPK